MQSVEVLGRQVTLPVEVREARSAAATFVVRHGEMILDLDVRPRPLPLPSKPAEMSAYARLDGMTRRTPFTSRATRVRGGPVGATLTVGDRHPMAQDLRSLGLPKRAVMSTIIGNLAATVGQPTKV